MIGFYCTCGKYVRFYRGHWTKQMHICPECSKAWLCEAVGVARAMKVTEA